MMMEKPQGAPHPRLLLWTLLVVYIFNFIDRQIVAILAEPISRDLQLSDSQLGLLTGLAFALFYATLGVPIARVADNGRSNRSRMIAVFVAVWSVMTALCGVAQNFWQLLLARIGVGVGEAGCTPTAHALIADSLLPEKRAGGIAFFGLGIPIGGLLGTLIGGGMAEALGWREAFWVVGIPGLLLAVAFSVGIVAMCWLKPELVYLNGQHQDIPADTLMSWSEMGLKIIPLALLIGLVLGGIYAGWFTATEAGAVGVLLALLIALVRRKLTLKGFWGVLTETGHVTVSVSFLIICANVYTRMLAMSGTPQALVEWMSMAGFGVVMFMFLYVLIILLLGTIIDSSSIMLIVLPLMLPIAQQFGLNLVWFGVVTVVAVEIGLLTPPFGLSAFVVKSSLDGSVPLSIGDVFRGTAPFTLMMTGVLVILMVFPSISLVLLK
jgi:TRAP-type C4-dicarboxylate transport system permease large subunit